MTLLGQSCQNISHFVEFIYVSFNLSNFSFSDDQDIGGGS